MFPFLALPLVPQELILKRQSPGDIFKFSLISRKAHLIAKRSKVAVETCRLCFWSYFTNIEITTRSKRDTDFFFFRKDLSQVANITATSTTEEFKGQIDDFKITIQCFRSGANIITTLVADNQNRQVLEKSVTSRLLDVWRVQKFSFCTDASPIPPYILDRTRKFENIHAVFRIGCLFKEDALTYLNGISVENFYMDSYVREPYKHQQPLKHRNMTLKNAQWFTKELLMSMECEQLTVTLSAPNLTSEDLEEFFEKWKKGEFPQLKSLDIGMSDDFQWELNMGPLDADGGQLIPNGQGNLGKLKIDNNHLVFEVLTFE